MRWCGVNGSLKSVRVRALSKLDATAFGREGNWPESRNALPTGIQPETHDVIANFKAFPGCMQHRA